MKTNYIPKLYRFLTELRDNNNREWFLAHKPLYDELRELWLADLATLIAHIAEWNPAMASQTPKSATYRIYRDTRFSLDKTPYKTYFSAAFCPQGRKAPLAAYYIQVGPNFEGDYIESGVYGGLWNPDAVMLRKMRRAIVDNIEEWEEIVHNKEIERLYPGWCGDSLKTIPKGWDRDHPQAEYLRLKSYGKFRQLDERFFSDPQWPERVSEMLRPLQPLIDFINYSITEE